MPDSLDLGRALAVIGELRGQLATATYALSEANNSCAAEKNGRLESERKLALATQQLNAEQFNSQQKLAALSGQLAAAQQMLDKARADYAAVSAKWDARFGAAEPGIRNDPGYATQDGVHHSDLPAAHRHLRIAKWMALGVDKPSAIRMAEDPKMHALIDGTS